MLGDRIKTTIMKNVLYFIMLVSFTNFGFAKSSIDTISNWQVSKDSHLLFKSHLSDSHRYKSTIKKSEEYKSLNVRFF